MILIIEVLDMRITNYLSLQFVFLLSIENTIYIYIYILIPNINIYTYILNTINRYIYMIFKKLHYHV